MKEPTHSFPMPSLFIQDQKNQVTLPSIPIHACWFWGKFALSQRNVDSHMVVLASMPLFSFSWSNNTIFLMKVIVFKSSLMQVQV